MYSIFHTSYCGSTLLACLLSKSVPTVTEPWWSHEIRKETNIDKKIDLHKYNHVYGMLVKYPSLTCDIAPYVNGKKVFLYRNFKDHIKKLNSNNIQYESILWSSRFLSMSNSKDVLFIESNELFDNKNEVCNRVCNHFNIEYKPIDIEFHVKQHGFNMRDYPIWEDINKLGV